MRPGALLFMALATTLLAGLAASRLTIRTSISELLPEEKRSVIVASRIGERLAAASTLIVVAQGEDKQALERFVDALGPELRALPPDLVGSVDDGVRAAQAYLEANAALYAPLEEVRAAHDRLEARYDYEVGKATGAELGLDDDVPPPITAETLRPSAERPEARELARRYPDGYYLEPSGRLIAIVVRTAVPSGDIARSRLLEGKVKEAIARVDPARFERGMQVDLAGDFIESLEENEQVKTDLGQVGAAGLALVLGVVLCFFLRVRTLAAMALTVGIGVVWTFGLAALTIGHLNASTGFLVSIVAGNGINFGILYMARYLEARRANGVEASIAAAHADTWASTMTAAGAAMVAYGSLLATSCRAFRQFGQIGGAGMVLCWIATFLFLPPMLVVSERILPLRAESGLASRVRGAYGRPFAYLATRFPRAIALGALALTTASLALAARYVAADPMEYDLGNTRTVATESRARSLEHRAAAVVGRGAWDGVAILVDQLDQTLPLKRALEARRDAAPADKKPFDKVITLFDFVPADQEAKLGLLAESRELLGRAHRRGLVTEKDWAELERFMPASLRPIGLGELPAEVAAPFTEKDGTRGRVAYVTPAEGRTLGDARYLMEWADGFRATTLPDGSVVEGSGRSVIFADLVQAVIEDAPRAILLSLGATMLVVAFAFRARKSAWIALGTLLVGLSWMLGFMAIEASHVARGAGGGLRLELAGMKLNFLNFVALPISIGVGADYAVNVVQRFRLAGGRGIRTIVVETGGAVILCSLTTTLGYLALTLSSNRAIRSFGVAAAAGEIGCVLAAVLALPAALAWREKARKARRGDDAPDSAAVVDSRAFV
jgi:predicted RND superfamily exporter protein